MAKTVFIVDLAADVDGDEFVETCPNLRIWHGIGVACLCVVASTLYIFSIDESPRCCTPEVYSFDLSSPTVLNSWDRILGKDTLERARPALGPKAHSEAIPSHVDGYVDLHKIAAEARNAKDEDFYEKDEEDEEFVKRVKSFKFCLRNRVLTAYVLSLFPF